MRSGGERYASLNPRLRVGQAISEAPLVHGIITPRERDAWLAQLLLKVGLDPSLAERYPHQFSGGHRCDYPAISGEIPSPLQPPSGCHFHPRCPHARAQCAAQVPALREIAPQHGSACILDGGSQQVSKSV